MCDISKIKLELHLYQSNLTADLVGGTACKAAVSNLLTSRIMFNEFLLQSNVSVPG